MIRIGTAGWSIPRAAGSEFPGIGTHLQRYARVLRCAEINSSFHRPHARPVYERWAASTPDDFRFAVKVPRTITHEGQLRRSRALLRAFLDQAEGLGPKFGPLLVQLPPSYEFRPRLASSFFSVVRELFEGAVVCEPRHISWFEDRATALLVKSGVARVATDPSRIEAAHHPGGAGSLVYYRLHGSPRKYWSRYPVERIRQWAAEVRAHAERTECWCIFDNTASGAAIENSLDLVREL